MRRIVFFVALGLLNVGCGSSQPHHVPARVSSAETQAMRHIRRVVIEATEPAQARPDYKIADSLARRLHGLDLWNAVVDPMISPLSALTRTKALRAKLNDPQYAVYVLFLIDTDIDDGGLAEVYYNLSGVFAQRAVALLKQVGARQHAAVLSAANRVIWPSGVVPASVDVRRRFVSPTNQSRFDEVTRRWDRAEQREGSIDGIIERYMRARPAAFFSTPHTHG